MPASLETRNGERHQDFSPNVPTFGSAVSQEENLGKGALAPRRVSEVRMKTPELWAEENQERKGLDDSCFVPMDKGQS